MNSSEIVERLHMHVKQILIARDGFQEVTPLSADISAAASHIEAQDKLIDELSEALNTTTNALEMTTGGQLCLNQIKRNRELVPAVKPSSAWPKK